MKQELPPPLAFPPARRWLVWWTAVRPRTLTIALTPVAVGTALAWAEGAPHAWAPALAAFLCAVLIQAGTNLHNDAADFERGTDDGERRGPLRVTAAGWASAREVRRAAKAAFLAAFALGGYLALVGGWPIVALGLASLLAGWSYSGGPRPISHTPLGEVFVFAFFGLAAVGGSFWLQAAALSPAALLAGALVGLPAAAVLMVNNHRDREGDLRSGRRTLAAVLGPAWSRRAYAAMLLAPYALLGPLAAAHPGALLALLCLPLSLSLVRRLAPDADGEALNGLLVGTARCGFLLGLLLAVGLSLY